MLRRVGLLAVLVAALWSSLPAPANAADGGRLLTLVARQCDTFSEITGNRARNNIQETLVPLGADSPYGNPAISPPVPNIVTPQVESKYQPNCRPITAWEFTTAGAYASRAFTDPRFGSLSIVKDPVFRTVTTKASIPLLDEQGADTGEQIQGAVTLELNSDEIKQLNKGSNSFWIQGGSPTKPITDADNYGFAALRCATDNLNGDNVEWVAYPPSTRHAFCYAYYVRPRPETPGKIVIKKVLTPQSAPTTVFQFESNASFTADNLFTLAPSGNSSASTSFERASGQTWSFEELVPAFANADPKPTCVSSVGNSTSTVDPSNPAKVSVLLGAGDTVTCTFTNSPATTLNGLVIRKVSLGGVDTFGYKVRDKADKVVAEPSITTTEPGVSASKKVDAAEAGKTYTIEESLPDSDVGDWALEAVSCTGGQSGPFPLGKVTVPSSGSAFCTFRNRFTPAGRIRVYKRTLGGTGTASFQIRPVKVSGKGYEDDLSGTEFQQIATTKAPVTPVRAEPKRGARDSTEKIDVGTYAIQETASVPDGGGVWRLVAIDCDRTPVFSQQGRIVVRLTADDPHVNCTFTNKLDKKPTPPIPPTPPTPPTPPAPQGAVLGEMAQSTPLAELRVTKTVDPRRIRLGHTARYRVVVRNLGPATARAVSVQEQGRSAARGTIKLHTTKGTCHGSPPRFCNVGNLRPGQRATITVTVRPTRTGRFPNIVAVHTGTRQRTSRGKRARAALTVVPSSSPRFTG